MPYRIDIRGGPADLFDRVVDLGALDAEVTPDGSFSALMPDTLSPEGLRNELAGVTMTIHPATGRDAGSVWILHPRPLHIAGLHFVPADAAGGPNTVRLLDSPAFGTGLHPSTALCVEALERVVGTARPASVLDIGTGSGILALAALTLGVPRAAGIDIDAEALRTAAANATLNGFGTRLHLVRGGPEVVSGGWPLVLANVLASPLIEMAPTIARRVARNGHLVLSGIASSLEREVDRAYRHVGMHRAGSSSRDGWLALEMRASW